jgi:hypothetical protein
MGLIKRSAFLAIASTGLVACASPAQSPSPTEASIHLRFRSDWACPAARLPLPLTFQIDAAADEDVVAVATDGRRYHVWWSAGFVGGTATDPVVRDPAGHVIARDGEVLREPTLLGNQVCATGDSIYVLAVPPA